MFLSHTVQVEAAARSGCFIYIHSRLWSGSRYLGLSRRLIFLFTFVAAPILTLIDHNWPRFLVASALALAQPSADPDQESPCLAQVLPARDQAWFDPFPDPPDPYSEWLCPIPFGPFPTLSLYCRDPDTTTLFAVSGNSTVAYSWTESLLLLEAWSEVEILRTIFRVATQARVPRKVMPSQASIHNPGQPSGLLLV